MKIGILNSGDRVQEAFIPCGSLEKDSPEALLLGSSMGLFLAKDYLKLGLLKKRKLKRAE